MAGSLTLPLTHLAVYRSPLKIASESPKLHRFSRQVCCVGNLGHRCRREPSKRPRRPCRSNRARERDKQISLAYRHAAHYSVKVQTKGRRENVASAGL